MLLVNNWVYGIARNNILIVVFVLACFLLALTLGRSTFVVSNERLYARIAWRRISIPMKKIVLCSVDEDSYSLRSTLEYSAVYSHCYAVGQGLTVVTPDNRYLFVIDKPETACKLINTALAARSQEAQG